MKVKELAQVLNNCDPEMEVFGDVHDGLWAISKAQISKWYNEEDMDKLTNDEISELREETALCLTIDCPLPIYVP